MTWTIRRPAPGDGPRLRELRLHALRDTPQAFLETHSQAAGLNDAEWESRIERYNRPGRQVLVIAETRRTWIGMLGAFIDHEHDSPDLDLPRPPLGPTDRWAMLWGAFVTPSHRSQGLADQLCAEIYTWAADEARVNWIGLDVRDSNTPAIRFYQRQNFQNAARRSHPALGVTSLVMVRPINT